MERIEDHVADAIIVVEKLTSGGYRVTCRYEDGSIYFTKAVTSRIRAARLYGEKHGEALAFDVMRALR